MKIEIDPELFKEEPIDTTLYCRCGASWRAHNKLKRRNDYFVHLVSKGCPNCGEDADVRRASSDPEHWEIGG